MDRRSTRGRTVAGAVALAVALALVTAGCTSTSKSSASAAATSPSAVAAATAAATTAPAAATVPSTSAPAAPTSSAPAPATSASSAAPKRGPGTNCGLQQATPNPDHLYLVIVSGNISCAAAQKQMTAYLASPDKQGSGGFATVNGWNCDHNSIAGFDDDGHYAECSGKDGDIVTQTATAKTTS